MNDTQERIIDKVLKLLALAENTNHPEEAEAFSNKAMELMIKAEIDDAMLASAKGPATDVITKKEITFTGVFSMAQRDLMFAVGRAQGFKLLQSNGHKTEKTGTWVGFQKDLTQAEVLLTSLLIQQTRAATTYFKVNPPT